MNVVNENRKIKLIQEIGSGQRDNIEELNDSCELNDNQQTQVNVLQKIIQERFVNKNDTVFSNINIVSLGESCVGRVIPTRWGLIATKEFGRLSMPFDLGVHYGESICKILDDEFQEYLKDENLFYENDWRCWKHLKYRVVYNHDTDLGFKDIEKLKERYYKRVRNFIELLKNGKKTFFLYSTFKSNFSDFDLLIKMLNKYSSNFHLVILNHHNLEITNINKFATVIDCPFPSGDYIWHDPVHYATQKGFEFEKYMIDNIIKIIKK